MSNNTNSSQIFDQLVNEMVTAVINKMAQSTNQSTLNTNISGSAKTLLVSPPTISGDVAWLLTAVRILNLLYTFSLQTVC